MANLKYQMSSTHIAIQRMIKRSNAIGRLYGYRWRHFGRNWKVYNNNRRLRGRKLARQVDSLAYPLPF